MFFQVSQLEALELYGIVCFSEGIGGDSTSFFSMMTLALVVKFSSYLVSEPGFPFLQYP